MKKRIIAVMCIILSIGLLFGKKGLDTRIKNKLDIRIKMKKVKNLYLHL